MKLKRDDIIKANKCCYDNGDSCLNCPFMNDYESCVNLNKNTSTLIEELVKESEALEKVIADLTEENETLNIRCQTMRVDTVRKMQERFIAEIEQTPNANEHFIKAWKSKIDQIAKEILEGV